MKKHFSLLIVAALVLLIGVAVMMSCDSGQKKQEMQEQEQPMATPEAMPSDTMAMPADTTMMHGDTMQMHGDTTGAESMGEGM